MIAVDDAIKDEAGKEAPFVGFSSPRSANRSEKSFPTCTTSSAGAKPGPETTVMAAEAQTVSVCMDRTDNAIAVFKRNSA